jgi:hypothetical protein
MPNPWGCDQQAECGHGENTGNTSKFARTIYPRLNGSIGISIALDMFGTGRYSADASRRFPDVLGEKEL